MLHFIPIYEVVMLVHPTLDRILNQLNPIHTPFFDGTY
jgi:hypothetical protein